MFVGPSPRENSAAQAFSFVTSHHDTYPATSPNNFNLSGKSVLVTGASRGIGKTTAIRYAMAGCSKIAIAARSPLVQAEKEIKAAAASAGHPEPIVLSLNLDVTSGESVQAAVDAVSKAFNGSLDILIANAGNSHEWVPMGETDPESWWETIEVNVRGPYLCTCRFLPLVLQSELKTILVVSSIGALVSTPGGSGYCVSKSAACRLVEFIDQEYHAQGVIAIALHPGGVATDLGLQLPEHMHVFLCDTPELAGDNMVWLANERREWLAGRMIFSNWDVTELQAKKEEIVEKDLLKFKLQFV